jgi:hypothetical protein
MDWYGAIKTNASKSILARVVNYSIESILRLADFETHTFGIVSILNYFAGSCNYFSKYH